MESLGKLNSLEIEDRIIKFWEDNNVYNLIKKSEPKDKKHKFFFLDGPPYTTGNVHLGTAWNKILKDLVIKYKRMQGFRVTDTPGYDTHGLPIEVIVEKNLGIKNKKNIKEYGLEKFILKCRNYATSQIGTMNEQFMRLGCNFWNWDNPYITLKNTYIQGVWWTIKKAWENGFLYKGFRPQNCCPRCGTALAKHEFEYHDISDRAIFVKFRSVKDPKTFYVIWTTTPWTLISNTNIMANPNSEYVKMRVKDEHWIMGIASTSDLLQNKLGLPLQEKEGFEYGERFTGRDLEGKHYIHPFAEEVSYQAELEKQQPKVHTIILSEKYVQETGGSGLVHCAPGHGPEDFEVGKKYGIPIFSPVEMDGCYNELAGKRFEGKYVHDVNGEIIDLLIKKGTLIHEEIIQHEYAHCWRCQTKLVYHATDQWFFAVSKIRNKLLKENEEIFWIPKYAGETNFKSWLTSLRDWCISRQRIWGIPLSIWECDNEDCENMDVIGSMDELKQKSGECPDDLHIPAVDKVTWKCSKCSKGTMIRVPDLADVWLDSGSVMWASQKFVDGKEHYDTWETADFILEGKDQVRGWFNSLLSAAMLSSEKRNYNKCYMHGWINSHGIKMSKSLGNSIQPSDIIKGNVEIISERQKKYLREQAAKLETSKFDKTKEHKEKKNSNKKKKYIKDDPRFSNINGIETFRFYSVGATSPGKDLNFDWKEYTDTFKILNTLWNCYHYAQQKMKINNFDPKKHKFTYDNLLKRDKWMLSRTNSMIEEITDLYDNYELPSVPSCLQDYILNDLSRWYITLIRDQVSPSNEDPSKYDTLAIFWYSLHKLCLVMAPLNPMLMEEIYQKMFRVETPDETKFSIHLDSWPKVEKKYVNKKLEEQMKIAKNIIDNVRSLKSENKVKLRWTTKCLLIKTKIEMDGVPYEDLIREMSNVKEISIIDEDPENKDLISAEIEDFKIYLDLEDSKELQQERITSDLLRTMQFMRKQNKLKAGEPITLNLGSNHPFLYKTISEMKEKIKGTVHADPIKITSEEFPEEDGWVNHTFHVCTVGSCYAMIRSKHVKKIESGKKHKCSYCKSDLTPDLMGSIQIKFRKN